MALKFRRGTTAQKSGSLAFGEPYVNTTLGTLQIGGDNGDVTLLINSASQGISGSSLDITGNAKIDGNLTLGGNITVGDATSDTLQVVASLSSSLIPSTTNTFDLGSSDKIWRDLYISTGSIKFYNATGSLVSSLSANTVNSLLTATGSIFTTSSYSSSVSGTINRVAYFKDSENKLSAAQQIAVVNTGSTVTFGTAASYLAYQPERVVVDSGDSYNIASFVTSKPDWYAQVNIINRGSGSNSSADLVLWNDLTSESSSYVDLGINSSNYSANNVGYGSDGYLYTNANDLYIGSATTGSHGHLHLFAGNQWKSSSISIYNDGTVGINTDKINNNADSIPTSGYAVEISGSVKFDNSINVTDGITGQIYATNGVVSGSSQVVGILSSLNSFSASNANTSLNSFTSSINTTIKSKLDTDGVISGSSQVNIESTTGFTSYSSSVDSRILTEKGRIDAILITADADKDSFAEIVTLINSVDTTNDNAFASFYTASVNRLSNLESTSGSNNISISNINSFTSSIDTTIKTKLNVEGVISGSSQLTSTFDERYLNTLGDGVYSSSAQINGNIYSAGSSFTIQDIVIGAGTTFGKVTTDGSKYISIMPTNNVESARFWANGNLTIQDAGAYVDNGYKLEVSGSTKFVGDSVITGSLAINDLATNFSIEGNGFSQAYLTSNGAIVLNPGFGGVEMVGSYRTFKATDITAEGFVSGEIRANNGVVSGSSQVVGILSSLNTYTGSNDTTNTSQNNRLSRLEESTASLNAFSASSDTTNQTQNNRLNRIEESTSSLNVFSSSINGHVSDINAKTGSFEAKHATLATYTASIDGHISDINTKTGSFETKNATLATYTASLETKNSTLASVTASLLSTQTNLNTYTSSLNNAFQITGSNTVFLGNITVYGSQSVINSENLQVNDNIIYLSPTASGDWDLGIVGHYNDGTYRHGGIFRDASDSGTWKVFKGLTSETIGTVDTGHASFALADFKAGAFTGTSFNGEILATNGIVSGSSQIQLGSAAGNIALATQTTGDYVASLVAGTNITLSNNSGENATPTIGLTNNAITIAGQSTALGSSITTETIRTAIGTVVTGSSQITLSSTTGYVANQHIDHTTVSITAGSGLSGGGDISTTRTLSIATGGVTDGMLAGSISNAKLTNSSITIAGQSTALGSSVTAETIRTAIGTVVTGSAQIAHDSTTGYSANKHIDHTAVTLTAGDGLTGGGDISTSRTFAVGAGTGISVSADAVSNTGVLSITSNTGLSSNVSATGNVTITNTGVTSNVAGTGISVSGATGAVTITNTGVTSLSAGTGITLGATTGACSISIGQSVATNATPTFGNLTINGTITATGDITAYYTSDRRHKNNIETIPNALEKVKQLNGVTWEWNDDVNEVTKSTPKTGLIAQEVQEVLPQVVTEREDGFLALDYSKMMGLLVEAIKEQQLTISKLESEVKQLTDSIRVFEENK